MISIAISSSLVADYIKVKASRDLTRGLRWPICDMLGLAWGMGGAEATYMNVDLQNGRGV